MNSFRQTVMRTIETQRSIVFEYMDRVCRYVCVYSVVMQRVAFGKHIQISGDDDDSFKQSLNTRDTAGEQEYDVHRYGKLRQLHIHTFDNIKNECQIWLCFGDMPFAIVFCIFLFCFCKIDEYDDVRNGVRFR